MGVTWRIGEAVVLESDEEATFQEWAASVDAALRDGAFRAGMGLVHDARRMTHVPTTDEANRRVEFLRRRMEERGISRWAVVVTSLSPVQYGMGRMAEAFAEASKAPFRVFKDDLEAAIAWVLSGPPGGTSNGGAPTP